jgi:hypothetical protein
MPQLSSNTYRQFPCDDPINTGNPFTFRPKAAMAELIEREKTFIEKLMMCRMEHPQNVGVSGSKLNRT